MTAVLRKKGHTVIVKEVSPFNNGPNILKKAILNIKPDIIGLQVISSFLLESIMLLKVVRSSFFKAKIVVGGPHMVVDPNGLLSENLADIAVLSEGEEVISEIADNKNLADIKGIHYFENGAIIKNEKRHLIKDLDTLPFPAFDLLPKYRPSFAVHIKHPAFIMACSRGCPLKCEFCTPSPGGTRNIRLRSAENCFDELKNLVINYKIREIAFYDDMFFLGSKKHISEFCERIIKFKLNISWWCQLHINFANKELLKLMARAGCYRINYGIESGDPEVLKKIAKGISLSQVDNVINWTRKADITSSTTFMMGNMGETKQSINNTIKYISKIKSDYVIILYSQPLPGSPMYAKAKAQNLTLIKDWKEFKGIEPTIQVPGIPYEYIVKKIKQGYLIFYLNPKNVINIVLKSFKQRNLIDNYQATAFMLKSLFENSNKSLKF